MEPRTKLTDAQWQRLEPLLPGKPTDPGRTGFDNRKTVEGILWIARTGAPWWDRPPYFGKGNAGRRRFRRWVQSRVLARLLDALPEDLERQIVMVDGTFVKVQQHGAGPERGAFPGGEPARPSRRSQPGRTDHQTAGVDRWPGTTGSVPIKAGERRRRERTTCAIGGCILDGDPGSLGG